MILYSLNSLVILFTGCVVNVYHLLNKYSEHIDPVMIPKVRESLKTLMSKSLTKRITSQSDFLAYLTELVGGEEALGGKKRFYVFLARMETLKQVFIEESIRSQEKYLIDFNVNVEYLVGSSAYDHLEEYVCILELFLKNNKTNKIEKVQVEMKKPELRSFISTLAKIQKEVKFINE
mmetsp:Transcript_25474/g.28295  ORF Transcript_25474/g.28295 Transcript_25474/m.28295 type:complete len:177 (+) Transcript_25474:33-563(+)